MSLALSYLEAAGATFKRDALVYVSYRGRWVAQIFAGLFSITLFHFISQLVRVSSFASARDYFAFAVIGVIINQVLQSALGISETVRGELVAGTFERLVVSPFGAIGGLLSMVLFPLVEALGMAVILLLVGGIVFNLPVRWSTAALALPIALLGSVAFASFGVLFASAVIVFKQASVGATWAIAGLSIVAGLYFPVSLLPDWIRWASDVQPFTPAVDLLRHVLVGTPLRDRAWVDVVKLAGFAAVLLPLAILAVRAAISSGRRRATLIEY